MGTERRECGKSGRQDANGDEAESDKEKERLGAEPSHDDGALW